MPPNAATVYGLYDIAGYDSLQTKAYKEWLNGLDGQDSSPPENGNMDLAFPSAMNVSLKDAAVKYIVSPQPISSGISPVYSDSSLFIYESPVQSGLSESDSMVGGSSNPDVGYLSNTRIYISTNSGGDLKINSQAYPGWVAKVNGISANLMEPSVLSQELDNLHDQSKIVISYQPNSFRTGLYLACAGLMAISFMCVFKVRHH
jgi:hypothetical protein